MRNYDTSLEEKNDRAQEEDLTVGGKRKVALESTSKEERPNGIREN
jgi:hypothetical protein